ncbi:transcription antitermination protein NusB [Candidatus Cardinium hertigii]|uniref:transcription antitermination protein NusB n=1 Tax=Candidatus Cardinium hertigii TaxID=247481 RepID=UPI003D7E9134
MENFLIPRRFVRIKALQNLYAYTIAKQVHEKDAIEQIKKDFVWDCFLDEPSRKEQLTKAATRAVGLFQAAIATALPTHTFVYKENKEIAESVYKQLSYYVEALKKDQTFLQHGFNQSKEYIYLILLYTLLLLVEWYKLAKVVHPSSEEADHSLKKQLAQNSLLEELYHNSKWIKIIYKNGISWAQDQDQVQNWYRQFIQSEEAPKTYLLHPNNSIKILEYVVQHIIFREGPINDFLAMKDLYWDEHKGIVKKILIHIFKMLSTKDFAAFTLFWDNLEEKWATESEFYSRILTIVIENHIRYEEMIGAQTQKWDKDRILLTDKLILKLALAELIECKEIPFKVSINEYIEIAKWYGSAKSGAFINGVLEGILKKNHN